MLRSEIEEVRKIASETTAEGVNAAVLILSAKLAELEMKIKKLSEAVEKYQKPVKQKVGLE